MPIKAIRSICQITGTGSGNKREPGLAKRHGPGLAKKTGTGSGMPFVPDFRIFTKPNFQPEKGARLTVYC